MNTNFCFDGHFLWEEFGKEKQSQFKTPNIFCNILLQYADTISNLKTTNKALETGTYQGHSAICLSKMFNTVDTIELFIQKNPYNNESLEKLYSEIKQNHANINFHEGSSPVVMKDILEKNKDETFVILLDAHTFNYSPMLEELKAIKEYSNKNDHIIIIDDCRFLGYNGYPPAEQMAQAVFEINKDYKIINTLQGNGILLIHT